MSLSDDDLEVIDRAIHIMADAVRERRIDTLRQRPQGSKQ